MWLSSNTASDTEMNHNLDKCIHTGTQDDPKLKREKNKFLGFFFMSAKWWWYIWIFKITLGTNNMVQL